MTLWDGRGGKTAFEDQFLLVLRNSYPVVLIDKHAPGLYRFAVYPRYAGHVPRRVVAEVVQHFGKHRVGKNGKTRRRPGIVAYLEKP